MKILNVNYVLDPVSGGGTAQRTIQMSQFLIKAGLQCTILTTDVGYGNFPDLISGEIIALPTLWKRFYFPQVSYKKIVKIVKNHDVIHLMGHWNVINVLVYFAAKKLNKPYIVCPAGALPIYGRSKIIKKIYNWIIGKRIIQEANGHVAITMDEVNQFEVYGVSPDKTTVIPNGINPQNFLVKEDKEFRSKYHLGMNPYILFIGRLNIIKGPDLLLRAFGNLKDKIPGIDLVFVGPEEGMLPVLKEIVMEYDIKDRVHFLGFLGGTDKSMAYHASELLVIPSRQEAMSMVVLEAGVTGTPVLLTDQCGFDEVASIDGGKVVSASVEGLEKGILELLHDTKRLKEMGLNLGKYILNKYTWDSIVQKYIFLFNKVY